MDYNGFLFEKKAIVINYLVEIVQFTCKKQWIITIIMDDNGLIYFKINRF